MGVSMSLSAEQKNKKYYYNHSIPRKNIKKDKKYKYNQVNGIYYVKDRDSQSKNIPVTKSLEKYPKVSGSSLLASKIRVTSVSELNKDSQMLYSYNFKEQGSEFRPLHLISKAVMSEEAAEENRSNKLQKLEEVQSKKEDQEERESKIDEFFAYKKEPDPIKESEPQFSSSQNKRQSQFQSNFRYKNSNYRERLKSLIDQNKKNRSKSLNFLIQLSSRKKSDLPVLEMSQVSKKSEKSQINQLKSLTTSKKSHLISRSSDKIEKDDRSSETKQIINEYFTQTKTPKHQQNPVSFKNIVVMPKFKASLTTNQYYSLSFQNSTKSGGSKYIPSPKLIHF